MPNNHLYVILHGHFYQPPREDPWTAEIDRQPSAYPFHDWNERINKECYAANAASRVLTGGGKIKEIINNYQYLSFNFGPTLLDWLVKNDPFTYEKILEADRFSMEMNNGHGNAIAQVYNHLIMPLASEQDKITQVEWGLRHFEKHFGRKSEGIWLAETAVNDRVAEVLIDYGIKYIILAPTQADKVRAFDSEEWKDVSDGSIDPSRPYRLKEANGELSVFFYYGDIAAKLSFQHLLQKADYLRGDLLAHNNEEKDIHLVHTATDGEVYGHHEPFGDMCLSRVVYDNRKYGDFTFTNYANFLDIVPPTEYVVLKHGNEGLGTAWSCAHGVDRWRADCGCSTGGQEGWNQQWRKPLRNALDFLRERLYEAAGRELQVFVGDIWKARNDYIDILMSYNADERAKNIDAFFANHSKSKLGDYDRSYVLRIMEALLNELLMYTSCGWFFAEISGIETVQDLLYAARVMELAEDILPRDTEHKFLEILSHAKSNIHDFQDGKWIFENFVKPYLFDRHRVINQYLLDNLLSNDEIKKKVNHYYFYDIQIKKERKLDKEGWQIYNYDVYFRDNYLQEEADYLAYIFNHDDQFRVFVKKSVDDSLHQYLDKIIEKDHSRQMINDFKEWFMESYSLTDMKYDSKKNLLDKLSSDSMIMLHEKMAEIDFPRDEYMRLLHLYNQFGVKISDKDMVAIKEMLNNYIFKELYTLQDIGIENYDFTDLIKTIQEAKRLQIDVDYEEAVPVVREEVLKRMNSAVVSLDQKEMTRLEKLIDFTNISGMDFEKYEIQNLLFQYIRVYVEQMIKGGLLKKINKDVMRKILRLGEKFNIDISDFENQLIGKI